MGKRLEDEEAACSDCGELLKFYPQPGLEDTKLEAFCQKCSGIRHKDPGVPVSLNRKDIDNHKEMLSKKAEKEKKDIEIE